MRRFSVFFAIAALACSGLAPLAPAVAASSSAATTAAETAPAAKSGPVEKGFTKVARPDGSSNVDSHIQSVIDASNAKGQMAAVGAARANGLAVSGDRVRVIVEASDPAQAYASIETAGASVEGTAGHLVQVLATPTQLAAMSEDPGIAFIRAPLPHREEAVAGEGVAQTNAASVQANGWTGSGVKVAIIDGGFAGLAASQASGDLPASVTTVDYCGGSFSTATSHGTAVSEIVHEMAPNAQLYLICIGTEVNLATAEAYVKANGITIVNHSMGWYNSSRGDGTGAAGTPDATVKDAATNGILWVNAAGNDATSHWSGTFIDDNSGYHDNVFDTASGDIGNTFWVGNGQDACAALKWDSWPTTSQDYDLYLARSYDGYEVGWSETRQTGKQDPTEETCFTNNDGYGQYYFVVIVKHSATKTPRFDLFLWGADLQYQVAAGSVAEPASSASAFAVGAHCWQSSTIESFSSQGPTIDGRVKPDIAGPDQTSDTIYGTFSNCSSYDGFAGTSAASPHVAGAAALVKSMHPTYTAAQLRTYLQTTSVDQGAAGLDSVYGSGNLKLPVPPSAPSAPVATPYNQSAGVTWTAPVNGGSAILGYTVTASPDGATCTTTGATFCTVHGLTNGTSYTFTVTATNDVGTSSLSPASNAVTPIAVPDAPVVTAIGVDSAINVSWLEPADHGSAISGYTVTAQPGGVTCTTTTALACTLSPLTNKTAYTISVVATNANGPGPAGHPSSTVTPRIGATYFGLTPNRLVDTRTSTGLSAKLSAYIASTFQVTGLHPGDAARNVPANATAVTGVLSVSGASTLGWLALTPEPDDHPTTSTINFPKADARSTGVTVPLGSGGKLSVTYGAPVGNTADVIFDVTGYFVTNTSGSTYIALTPNRLVDSRPTVSGQHTNTGLTSALVAGTAKTFQVTGRTPSVSTTNVPSSAVAVTGTLTVTGQTTAGYLTLGPDALNNPDTTSLFFPKGDNRATGLTVKLGAGGTLGVTFTSTTAGAKSDIVFDVTGYFVPGTSGATYVPLTPNRIVDNRTNLGITGKLKNHVAATFTVINRVPGDSTKNVPTGAVAITGTLTVTGQTYLGWLALTMTANNNPTTSSLNFPKGDNRATGVTAPLSPTGTLSVTYGATSGQTTYVVFDVTGYFLN